MEMDEAIRAAAGLAPAEPAEPAADDRVPDFGAGVRQPIDVRPQVAMDDLLRGQRLARDWTGDGEWIQPAALDAAVNLMRRNP